MMRSLLRDTESDLVRLLSSPQEKMAKIAPHSFLMRLSIRVTNAEMSGLREKLDKWVKERQSLAGSNENRDDAKTCGGLIALYPTADCKRYVRRLIIIANSDCQTKTGESIWRPKKRFCLTEGEFSMQP